MIKKFFIVLTIIVLTSSVASCKTTEDKFLAGEIIQVEEVCKTLDTQLKIYNAYKKSSEFGQTIYHKFIYQQDCFLLQTPVLAKKLKLEFTGDFDDKFKIEIWQIVFSENIKEGEKLEYFYVAHAVELSTGEKIKDLSV
tara:strand:+ start:341 stop:757 length:417 start_codon:yes stop_codon:yes gene_type:complete